jgi:SAM-dependent methyltransferase
MEWWGWKAAESMLTFSLRMRLRWRLAQFFEVRWWQRYLRGKQPEQYLEHKRAYWHKLMSTISAIVPVGGTESIIDMGCGPSGIYIIFPNNPIVAVDPLLEGYKANLEVFDPSWYSNVKFVTSSIEEFTTQSKFQYVFCMNAINHVSDIGLGFKQLASFCLPNGKVIVTIDAHNNAFMKAIFRIGPGDVLHPHQYDKQEYINFLTQNGLSVVAEVCLKREPIFSHYLLVAEKTGSRNLISH